MAGRLALAALLLLLVLPGSAAAAAPCPQDHDPGAPARFVARVATIEVSDLTTHTVVVVCDRRTGRRARLRRATLHLSTTRARGRILTDASAAGRFVAWTETRVRSGWRFPAFAVLARLRDGKPLRSVRLAGADGEPPVPVAVAVTSRGELGVLDPDGLLVARPGRPTFRAVRAPTDPLELVVVDDQTFTWPGDELGLFDLPRAPATTCRLRPGYTIALPSAEALVSARHLPFGGQVVRACLAAQPRDLVVGLSRQAGPATTRPDALAAQHGFAAIIDRAYQGRGGCLGGTLRTVDLRTGRDVRVVRVPTRPTHWQNDPCAPPIPRSGEPVITTAGAPVWLTTDGDARVVLAGGADGLVHELDRGDVHGLRADGDRVVWTNGGTERSAVP